MIKEDAVREFSEFLKEEGYPAKIDDDGDIVFKAEGKNYLLLFDDKDDTFFRIVFPNFWSIESPEERLKVEQAALKATADTKVGKVFIVGDDTWATIEMFSSSIDNAKSVFPRSMQALQAAIGNFAGEMRK